MQFIAHIFEQFLAVLDFLFAQPEGISFILSLIYVWLSIAKNKNAWLFSILAAGSAAYAYWQSDLYPTMGLQFFFAALSVYGYYQWSMNEKKQRTNQQIKAADVLKLNLFQHLLAGAACFVLFDAIRYFFLKTGMPYQSKVEIFAVAASLVAQYLQTKSYQENWMWWFFINILYVWINIQTKLYLFATLYAIFIVLSAQGWSVWQKKRKMSAAATSIA